MPKTVPSKSRVNTRSSPCSMVPGAAEKAQLEKLGLRVIDASGQGWGIINHDLFLSNAQIRQVTRRAIVRGIRGNREQAHCPGARRRLRRDDPGAAPKNRRLADSVRTS